MLNLPVESLDESDYEFQSIFNTQEKNMRIENILHNECKIHLGRRIEVKKKKAKRAKESYKEKKTSTC